MSLLLQALQRAARSREGTGLEPETTGASRLELEPQPAASPTSAPSRLDADEFDPAPPSTRRTVAPPPYLAGGADYGTPSALDYVRERPVVAFGAVALLLAVGYGVYVYMQIFHPQWLRGDFGRGSAVMATIPPSPASISPPSSPAATAYTLPPASTYPAANGPAAGSGPGTAATSSPVATPLPGFAPQPGTPAPTASPSGTTQSPELASLMNLPARKPAQPAAAPAPSRLSQLGSALNEGASATDHAKTPPTGPSAAAAPATRAAPAQLNAARGAAPVNSQSTARPRNPPPAKSLSMSAPGPAQAGANMIELKDQVVVNAAPSAQIEAITVADAYRAWKSGRLDQARDIYREVLSNEPKNVDALLGLGGIAQQQGNAQDAIGFFARALELDPRNSSAQAGIIAMTGQSDPASSESRLKQLIAREPSGFLHFTLGNLYARQGQWAQSQQSYFQAYSMNADNADYAYNLAVSLEHIGQDKLAITYYRKAVDLSLKQGGRASFNQEQVIDRIAKLSLRAR